MTTQEKPSKETLDQWREDPLNWKCGIFYYNKKDKRIFPPKRYFWGWTINFANTYSIFILLLIITLIFLLERYIHLYR
jgi:uncharacterized membrane protein